MASLRIKRGSRAAIAAAAVAAALAQGEPYYITDEGRIAIGTGAGTYAAFVKQEEIGYVSVVAHGAVADDTTDCSTAFANAITAAIAAGHKRVYVPGAANYYRLVSTVTVATSGVTIYGDGPHATKIRTESTASGFDVNSGLVGVSFQHFMLTRTAGTAGSGKAGIRFITTTEQAVLRNLYLSRHQIGLSLGGTNYSYGTELLLTDNYSHGISIASNSTNNTLQWTFFKCLAQRNDGYGIAYSTSAGTAQSSVGDIQLFSTYANKLGGASFVGKSGAAIQGVRWFGGFVGEDGGNGLSLSTYNTVEHKIEGLFSEIAGTAACGVDGGTAATLVGNGIWADSNNGPLTIKNCVVVQNSYSGIYIAASRGHIVGCTIRANGYAGISGEKNGIRIGGGETSVVGCTSKGHANYGVYSDVDGAHVVGNDLRENTTAGYGQTPAVVNSVVMGNAGYSTHNLVGSLQVSGNLTTISGLIGYSTGAGGTVTQATDKSTAVTLNKSSGVITMNNAALANGAVVTFTLNNSLIGASDVVLAAPAGFAGPYRATVANVAAGSCQITVQNSSGGSLSDALKINFVVIKVATA